MIRQRAFVFQSTNINESTNLFTLKFRFSNLTAYPYLEILHFHSIIIRIYHSIIMFQFSNFIERSNTFSHDFIFRSVYFVLIVTYKLFNHFFCLIYLFWLKRKKFNTFALYLSLTLYLLHYRILNIFYSNFSGFIVGI